MSKDFDPNKVERHTAYNDDMDCPELGEGVGEYVNAGDYDQLLSLYNASQAELALMRTAFTSALDDAKTTEWENGNHPWDVDGYLEETRKLTVAHWNP